MEGWPWLANNRWLTNHWVSCFASFCLFVFFSRVKVRLVWSDTVFLCYLPLVFEALLVVSCAECRWEIPAAGGQGPSEGSARGRWCHRRGGYSEAEVLSYDTETNRFTGESWRLFTKGDRAEFQMSENIQIWLVVWNMFSHILGIIMPIVFLFSEG